MELIKQKTRQLARLNDADYYNGFLVRAAKQEITKTELSVTRVEARLNAVPINQLDERAVIVAFAKIISDIFEYFNADPSDNLIGILVSDIVDEYGVYSPLEIYKALHIGRRKQTDLYGKLSGLHLTKWLNDYFADMGEELAEYRRNERFKKDEELDALHIPDISEKIPGFKPPVKTEKRTYTPAEIAAAERSLLMNRESTARREHSNKWNFAQHGDYKTYMEKFDRENV